MTDRGQVKSIKATVPLASMFGATQVKIHDIGKSQLAWSFRTCRGAEKRCRTIATERGKK